MRVCNRYSLLMVGLLVGGAGPPAWVQVAGAEAPTAKKEATSSREPRFPRRNTYVPLLENPRKVHDAFVHPEGLVRTTFSWKKMLAEWDIRAAAGEPGYAGFRFTRALDLSAVYTRMALTFQVRSKASLDTVRIGVMQAGPQGEVILLDQPVTPFRRTTSRTGWTVFLIPLKELKPVATAAEPVAGNWSSVQAIRVSGWDYRADPTHITLRHLAFCRLDSPPRHLR